jgi:transketolase N-terminal domain/subunit
LIEVAIGLALGVAAVLTVLYVARLKTSRQVVVHTKDDQSLRGHRANGVLTVHLHSPEYLDEDTATSLEGDVRIPRSNVAWVQEL